MNFIFKQNYFLPHSKRSISITKTTWLMLFADVVAVYYENITKHKTMNNVQKTKKIIIYTLHGQHAICNIIVKAGAIDPHSYH
jgi:hypothetical protein